MGVRRHFSRERNNFLRVGDGQKHTFAKKTTKKSYYVFAKKYIEKLFLARFQFQWKKWINNPNPNFEKRLSITIQSTKLDCNPDWAIHQSNPATPCLFFIQHLRTFVHIRTFNQKKSYFSLLKAFYFKNIFMDNFLVKILTSEPNLRLLSWKGKFFKFLSVALWIIPMNGIYEYNYQTWSKSSGFDLQAGRLLRPFRKSSWRRRWRRSSGRRSTGCSRTGPNFRCRYRRFEWSENLLGILDTWGQFHQLFLSSFCADILAPKKF